MPAARRLISVILAIAAAGVLLPAGPLEAVESDFLEVLVHGDPGAQTALGLRYVHAEGVPRDAAKAVRLLCAAARRGHAPAQYELGWLYANGRAVARDDALAAAWFRLAARNGDAHAARLLRFVEGAGPDKAALCVSPAGVHGFPPGTAPTRAQIAAAVRTLAPRHGLEPALVLAVIEAESGFDAAARSPRGALGLMQLMPATAARFGVRDRRDPAQNLEGGMAYLAWLLAHFDGDVRLALAGYNAGEQAVARYGGVPPYPETRAYVEWITRRYTQPYHPLRDATLYAARDAQPGPVSN